MNLKQSILGFTGLLLIAAALNAQTATTAYQPKIIPPSPNAASIAKFVDVPVSPYTGTADVSIPFYTVKTKSISVPVSISYHTGGIRLAEEAGLVGLGWALSTGGQISRTINDKDDFEGNYFNGSLPVDFPEPKGRLSPHNFAYETSSTPWLYTFRCNYRVYTPTGSVSYFPTMPYFNSYDKEPDLYNFSFPGGGGKFIIGRDGKIILQKQENFRIEYGTNGDYFVITDDHGNKFYFNDKEYLQEATGSAPPKISSWQLSKIITPQKDSIEYNYIDNNSSWTFVKGNTHETLRKGVGGMEDPIYSNDVGTFYLNKTLQNIDWENGQVQFEYETRDDLQDGRKLSCLKVFAKDQSGLHYQKEHKLYYSYFNPVVGGNAFEFLRLRLDSVKEISGNIKLPPYVFNYNMPTTQTSLMGKHYSSVDHWGYFNGVANAISTSSGLDFQKGFTPEFRGIAFINNVSVYLDLPGANREPNSGFMTAFSLQKVQYPTGGSTEFAYEPNYYDYDSSKGGPDGKDFEYTKTVTKAVDIIVNNNGTYTGTVDFSDIYLTSYTNTNANLTVSFRASSSERLNYYHNNLSFGKIQFTFNGNTTDIVTSGLQCSGTMTGNNCSGMVYSKSSDLIISSPTTYSWTGYIDPSIVIANGSNPGFMEIKATITYQTPVHRTTTMMMAGGLRVQSITDYTATGAIAKKKVYNYGYKEDRNSDGTQESYSYGKLMGYVSYARNEVLETSPSPGNYTYKISLSRYSSSISNITSFSSGNIVGYSQVEERTIDPGNDDDNGKIVYTFHNTSDTSFNYAGSRLPGTNNLPSNLNGLTKSKTIFKVLGRGYNELSSTKYYYSTANRIIYNCAKFTHYVNATAYNNNIGGIEPCHTDVNGNPIPSLDACDCPNDLDSATWQLMACFYPAISSERVLLDSTVEKLYDQQVSSKAATTRTYHYYDNNKHYQLTRSKMWDSKSNMLVSSLKYPQDYITSGIYTGNAILDSMIGRNMIGEVIEKRDSIYYAGSSTGYVKGAHLSKYRFLTANVLGLDKQYQLSISSPITNFQPFAVSGSSTSQDSRYRQMISFDGYDNDYNILQFTVPNQPTGSFIYDYNGQYPVAQIINATSDQVAYTSFESDGKGNWNNYTGVITNATASSPPPTGNKYYNLTAAAILSKGVTSGKTYILSYWSKNGLYTITGGGTPVNTTGKTLNGWTYYEQKFTAAGSSITLSGTGAIDEVRLYPFDAQMTTYTYDAFGNTKAVCDINNRPTYYEYDAFQRLRVIRDQDRNVIKKICYNYAGQPSACEGKTFTNTAQSQNFRRLNCSPSYYNGSTVVYTVPANTYFSEISAEDANQQALDDISANGQNYANTNGTCAAPAMISLKYINPGSTSMTAKFKHVPSGVTYTFTLSPAVTLQTTVGQIMEGGPYDVTITPNSGLYSYNFQVYSYMQMNTGSFNYLNMPSICVTCATVSITNQH